MFPKCPYLVNILLTTLISGPVVNSGRQKNYSEALMLQLFERRYDRWCTFGKEFIYHYWESKFIKHKLRISQLQNFYEIIIIEYQLMNNSFFSCSGITAIWRTGRILSRTRQRPNGINKTRITYEKGTRNVHLQITHGRRPGDRYDIIDRHRWRKGLDPSSESTNRVSHPSQKPMPATLSG